MFAPLNPPATNQGLAATSNRKKPMSSLTTRISHTFPLKILLPPGAIGLLILVAMVTRGRSSPASISRIATTAPAAVAGETYGRIPLSFEANHGQAESAVDFLARCTGYTLFLKPTEAVFLLKGSAHTASSPATEESSGPTSPTVLRMTLVGAKVTRRRQRLSL